MAHTFVKDVMKTNLVTLNADHTIQDAAKKMQDAKVGCVIVEKDGVPAGIVTEKDFVNLVALATNIESSLGSVMSSPLFTVSGDDTVWEAAQVMKSKKIHKVPVKDGSGKVIGIVTATDLVDICSLGSDSEMRRICDEIVTRMEKSSEV